MLNSILYFEEYCIKNFEKLEDEFLKSPKNFAEYVFGITSLLCKFGTEMLKDSLETMDRMLCESTFRQKSWSIEAHHTKTLVTSLGEVTFKKTLFLNKQTNTPEEKKNVDWLYIDADEYHVALQFQKNKGDLTKAENGVKNNGLITKMVCVYEGKEEETMYSKRRVLTNRHFFCGVNSGEANLKFWDDIYGYLERNYDLGQVKRIYLNADGGSWIKAGAKRLKGVTYVLDGFHLEKYLAKLVPHLKRKERIPVLEAFRKTIRNQTKDDFRELVEKQKKEMPKWRSRTKVEEAAEYILSNWTAAKLRLRHKEGVLGSSTESHVSHILSARMSSRPMGWSRKGAAKMAELRAYFFNGGNMLELVRYQKNVGIEEEKKEEKILSSTEILKSEKNRHGELGKYLERISHSLSRQAKKKVYFQAQIRGL